MDWITFILILAGYIGMSATVIVWLVSPSKVSVSTLARDAACEKEAAEISQREWERKKRRGAVTRSLNIPVYTGPVLRHETASYSLVVYPTNLPNKKEF